LGGKETAVTPDKLYRKYFGSQETPFAAMKVQVPDCKKVKIAKPVVGAQILFALSGSGLAGGVVTELVGELSFSAADGSVVKFDNVYAHTANTTPGDCGSLGYQGTGGQATMSHIGSGVLPRTGARVNFAIALDA
jgi:hypothetical protein